MFEIQGNSSSSGNKSDSRIHNSEADTNPFAKTIAFQPSVLNGMSHEMRTQMNAIVAFSFLLKDSTLIESEKEEFINQIYFTCEKLISLFENYLESAVVDTGGSTNDIVNCNMNNLLDQLIAEFREILQKSGKNNIELITETQFSGTNEICIDKNKIFRLIRCLFHNSLQNTNSGYIKIGYYNTDNEITFYVLDSGQGYSKTREFLHTNDLSDSLGRYQDLSSAINLSLAKKLIQVLHGSFSIRGNGTSGTGIYFTVPVITQLKTDTPQKKFAKMII
ncbi:MAG: HAMP domain-containing histidine kinase [Bacteroidetes bacterium]|nr:HAMP domain-containing histidine kinase [Bacteroidota bacterium]